MLLTVDFSLWQVNWNDETVILIHFATFIILFHMIVMLHHLSDIFLVCSVSVCSMYSFEHRRVTMRWVRWMRVGVVAFNNLYLFWLFHNRFWLESLVSWENILHQWLLDAIDSWKICTLSEMLCVNFQILVAFLVVSNPLRRKITAALEFLEHVCILIEHDQVDFQVTDAGKLFGFLDQFLFTIAFDFLQSLLGLIVFGLHAIDFF